MTSPNENPAFIKTARDERLWMEAKQVVADEYAVKPGSRRYWALVNRVFHRMQRRVGGGCYPNRNPTAAQLTRGQRKEHQEHPWLTAQQARRVAADHLRDDPRAYAAHTNPGGVVEHYRTFHGAAPDQILEGRVEAPGPLMLLGPGVDVGYGILDRRSKKEGWYVHDFGPGVKIYRRARKSDPVDRRLKRFPRRLMVLGRWLGFTVKVRGKLQETAAPRGGTHYLATSPDRKMLVVAGPRGVEYVMMGGRMHVGDWIRD